MDDYGRAVWLGLTLLAAWPLSLVAVAFLVTSGRTRDWWDEARRTSGSWFYLRRTGEEKANRSGAEASQSGGNQAFNTCRTVELNQPKVQENDFRVFLNRLCLARTNEEFDRFVAERGHGGAGFSSEWSGA